MGYTNVKSMTAGLSGWKEAKGVTETGDLKAPEKKKPEEPEPA